VEGRYAVESHDGEVHLRLVSQSLRRRRLLIIGAVLIAVGLGVVAGLMKSPTYTATSTLLLQPLPGNPLSPETATANAGSVSTAMVTEANLVDTPAVVIQAAKAAKMVLLSGPKAIQATNPANTQIIKITYSAATPDQATAGSQALSRAFLESRIQRAEAYQAKNLASLHRQAETAQTRLDDATTRARDAGPDSLAAQQVQIYASLVASINDSISQYQSSSLNPGSIVNPATTPHAPSGLPPWLLPAGLGMLALVGAVAIAIWLELRRDVIRATSESDVDGTPIIGELPAVGSSELVNTSDPRHELVAEAYRRLRAGVLATTQPPYVVSVTAVEPQVASAPLAINLANALGHLGYSVTVVDAARNGHVVDELLDISAHPGLVDAMEHPGRAQSFAHAIDEVRVLPAGSQSDWDIFAGRQFEAAIDSLRGENDYVLLISDHAATAAADAAAAVADGVLMVVSDEVTTHARIASTMRRLDRLGRVTIGIVTLGKPRRGRRKGSPVKAATRASSTTPEPAQPAKRLEPRRPALPATERGSNPT